MFKENPLAGSLQPCLYQSRTLGYKYGRHNEKITAQWLGCKLVWIVYCMRNAFPPPFSPSAIPHTEENPRRQTPFHVPFLCSPELAPLCTWPYGSEEPHLDRKSKVEGGQWRKRALWSRTGQPGGGLISFCTIWGSYRVGVGLDMNLGLLQQSRRGEAVVWTGPLSALDWLCILRARPVCSTRGQLNRWLNPRVGILALSFTRPGFLGKSLGLFPHTHFQWSWNEWRNIKYHVWDKKGARSVEAVTSS